MSSVYSAIAVVVLAGATVIGAGSTPPLRVCADPNNMPFSNLKQEGFENRIATLVGREMHRSVAYFWSPQRRGFVRNTLNAERCDVVIGVPARYGILQPTVPYYRSSYVFVSRGDRDAPIGSFDDARLKALTIGIQITGDDYNNPPAAQALALRHIIQNVRGYPVYGDYSKPDPQRGIVDAVAAGDLDVAVIWGPLAGYYAQRARPPLHVRPIRSTDRDPAAVFTFEIAMGVRRDDVALRETLDAIITRRHAEIQQILKAYGVPLT